MTRVNSVTHPCGSVTYDIIHDKTTNTYRGSRPLNVMEGTPYVSEAEKPVSRFNIFVKDRVPEIVYWSLVGTGAVITVATFTEVAIVSAVAIGVGWISMKFADTDDEPNYQYGPRGGRYTVEKSYDGGVYKRYR